MVEKPLAENYGCIFCRREPNVSKTVVFFQETPFLPFFQSKAVSEKDALYQLQENVVK